MNTASHKNSAISPASTKGLNSQRRRAFRMFVDRAFGRAMGIGGMSVIVAILLIFFYLLYEVFPLFIAPDFKQRIEYPLPNPSAGKTLGLVLDEQIDVGVRYTDQGQVVFFKPTTGEVIDTVNIPLPANSKVTSWAQGEPSTGVTAFGLSDGQVFLLKHEFIFSFPNNVRIITPKLDFLFDAKPLTVYHDGTAIEKLVVQSGEEGSSVIAWSTGKTVKTIKFQEEESFLDETVTVTRVDGEIESPLAHINYILLDRYQRELYLADTAGQLFHYDVSDVTNVVMKERVQLVSGEKLITSLAFLSGDISLLIGDSEGEINQWFAVRNDDGRDHLTKIRSFHLQRSAISQIIAEYNRKGFVAVDEFGKVGVFHTTADRRLLMQELVDKAPIAAAIAPRANGLIVEGQDQVLSLWDIHNEHPEISWKSLWKKVWYESYPEPDYIWQSSAADNVFEPKFSLMPLAFGTFKAAFYAMLVAMPIAILGAIYTAYFMSPKLRQLVKPTIEIMEALPTVILGFLAGLWLAPLIEAYLPGIFSLAIIIPLGCVLFAYGWHSLPERFKPRFSDGWEPLFLIPAILFLGWLSFAISPVIEDLFFNGDVKNWLVNQMGIGFDQRNSIVVGLAMGFAVIPTIFSITEDAVFSVPKHLTIGSLALGATPWQTMTRVVILTASPGIFSAVMIGLGRAVGETMIVLMATGNTPIMDLSIFEGMRTLAANIAVEMPESEVGSTHYRVLFLAALVLFAFTFVMNTAAEIVRHRLRKKYSSL